MDNKFYKKYLMTLAMFLLMAGHGVAQNSPENTTNSENTEQLNPKDTVPNNFLLTLTHTMPFGIRNARFKPENPIVKFSHVDDALYAELGTFAHMTGNAVWGVFSPLVVVKPFVRFYDKLTIGVTTTQMIQNYTTKSMTSMTHDMYAYATLNTKIGNISLKAGNFSILNYSADFAKYMPISTFFINALYLQSGAYFPRATVVGFDNAETACALGYAEDGSGFKFDGVDGYFVCLMEIKFEDSFKIGGLVKTNRKSTLGNIHVATHLMQRSGLLLEFLNIGKQFAVHMTYCYKLRDDKASFSINGFYQSKDGIAGGNINLQHTKTGVYAGIGATYHDPLHANKPDGTPNENWDKAILFLEFGVKKSFYPNTK